MRRPVTAAVLILIFIVVGTVGYSRLGVDRFPQVDFPTVTVTTSQPGAAPDAIESEITDKIEEAVNTISGIDELRSYSSEGNSTVSIQFVLEKDVNVATQEVRDRVANVQNRLPEDVDPPTVRRFDSSQIPVVSIAVTAKRPLKEITEWADKTLRRRFESVSGVGQVDIRGGRARQINIWLDAYKLRSFNLSVADVNKALQAQNVEIPGGRIDRTDKTLTLRTLGRITRLEDFNNIMLRTDDAGGRVQLSDVARIEDGVAQASSFSEISGVPTVQVVISKQSGTNTIAVIEGVKARLADIEPTANKRGYALKVVRDQSDYIEASLHSVEEHLIVGAILATLVVLFFLWNWRSTMISAISIPTSIVATFALMYYAGFTLNLITLLALTLAVGIVIDDAIVVLENIYRYIEEKGMSPAEAAVEGTREIGFAVMATTLSLVAVFLPVAFMSGIVGRFMNSFGMTMSFAILVSLLIAFTLVPSLSARFLRSPHANERPRENTEPGRAFNESSHLPGSPPDGDHVQSKDRGVYAAIDRFYTMLLKWSLAHRWVIVVASIAVLFSTVPLSKMVRANFLPDDDESQFQVSMELPQGASLDASTKLARYVDAKLRAYPWVDYTILSAGDNNNLNESSIFVRMKDVKKRTLSQFDAVQLIQISLSQHYSRSRPVFRPARYRLTLSPASVDAAARRRFSMRLVGRTSTCCVRPAKKPCPSWPNCPGFRTWIPA